MKATLEFSLPEEREEFEDASKGAVWRSILHMLDGEMRMEAKHSDDDASATQAQRWRQRLGELVADNDLAFYG